MGDSAKDILAGFCWGIMLTCAIFAYGDYSKSSNATEYKEKSLLELKIEYKKLEIKTLKKTVDHECELASIKRRAIHKSKKFPNGSFFPKVQGECDL